MGQRAPKRLPRWRCGCHADACPVKDEIYRVAGRFGLEVTLVANSFMNTPQGKAVRLEVVGAGADAADDWIVEHVAADDLVITSDIPLASRCVKAGADVLGPTGEPFDEDNVGQALAMRDLLTELRSAGETTSGPAPMTAKDRSRFLQQMDVMLHAIKRRAARRTR